MAYAVERGPRSEIVFDDDEPEPVPARDFMSRVEYAAMAPTRAITRLRARLDRREQPFLTLLLSINWVQWFVAFVVAWMVFAALYWILPGPSNGGLSLGGGFAKGVGSGIWQGLYYWLDQQQVARGGQPVYYYLLLIPLYEQLAVVFGLGGLVYSLVRPTRFRLFLVWWFVASLGLYSWAGEKMPWLSIHILLPLFLLAGVALNWIALQCFAYVPTLFGRGRGTEVLADGGRDVETLAYDGGGTEVPEHEPSASESAGALEEASRGAPLAGENGLAGIVARALQAARRTITRGGAGSTPAEAHATAQECAALKAQAAQRRARRRGIVGLAGAVTAVMLLIPMVHSMWVLSRPDAADGPLEMMVYVQTTNDVDLVMNKISHADQVLYHGQHKLSIAVGSGEEWPMYWYLRNYANVNYEYNPATTGAPQDDVLILLPSDAQTFMAQHPTGYTEKQYRLRAWFDESYKPLPCTPTKANPCTASANWGSGVGLGNYLTYGSNPPANAHFQLGKAAGRLWAWLWLRQPLGVINGSYDFTFIVRNGLPIQP